VLDDVLWPGIIWTVLGDNLNSIQGCPGHQKLFLDILERRLYLPELKCYLLVFSETFLPVGNFYQMHDTKPLHIG
jgi:hypothetical protein